MPTEWSETKGVVWKAPLPPWGCSTPAIWGDAIFLTSQTEDGKLLALRPTASDGKTVWTKEIGTADTVREAEKRSVQKCHKLHNNASPSLVVSNENKNPNWKISKDANSNTFAFNDLAVEVIKNPFQFIYKHKGAAILSEKSGYTKRKHIPLENVKGNIIYDSTEVLQFKITPDEVLYGGGSRALGMNRRGNRLALYNRAQYGYETRAELMNFCIPVVLSSKLYAVHFDNAAIGYLDLDSKKDNTLAYETISGRKT